MLNRTASPGNANKAAEAPAGKASSQAAVFSREAALLFEKHSLNEATWLPKLRQDEETILRRVPPQSRRKSAPRFPSLSELDVVRHFTNLSRKNFCIDSNFYPLGSCTMKYNPKCLDSITASTAYSQIHPYQDAGSCQGALQVLYEMQELLKEITGMDAFTLQPAAGAHGEFCGILMAAAFHRTRGKTKTKVLIPDSAHGTNPASAALCGYEVVQVKTSASGLVDLEDLKSKLDDSIACFMMTNPNTLGLFEKDILEIARRVHEKGALLYYDGANMNALTGITRPGDMGFDIVHINLHKTFAVPHGSGGPGSGPVGVKKELAPFLPVPRIEKRDGRYCLANDCPQSIGRMRSFYGNFGAIIRSYAYIKALGREGLTSLAENAILNANYLKASLRDFYEVPYSQHCMHEFVASAKRQKTKGVTALDIAKRLLDYGIHAPTVYFPLIVEEALMIEPTETESKATLDLFVAALAGIQAEIDETPDLVKNAPHTTPVARIDEVQAARKPNLRYRHA